jgi:hypothetical protein
VREQEKLATCADFRTCRHLGLGRVRFAARVGYAAAFQSASLMRRLNGARLIPVMAHCNGKACPWNFGDQGKSGLVVLNMSLVAREAEPACCCAAAFLDCWQHTRIKCSAECRKRVDTALLAE